MIFPMPKAALRSRFVLLACTIIAVTVMGKAAYARGVGGRLTEGKFGRAVDLTASRRRVVIPIKGMMQDLPVTFEFWAKVTGTGSYHILLAAAPKSGKHWEVYTECVSGLLALYVPQLPQSILRSSIVITDNAWHFISFRITPKRVELYCDGKSALDVSTNTPISFDDSPIVVGGIEKEPLWALGIIDDLRISRRTDELAGHVPTGPAAIDDSTLHVYHFDELDKQRVPDGMPSAKAVDGALEDEYSTPQGNRFLDEVQDEEFAKSGLYGDADVERESRLPARKVEAAPAQDTVEPTKPLLLSLSGEWRMNGIDAPSNPADPSAAVLAEWFSPTVDKNAWRRVKVPTTVQSALIKLGELADPFWNTNTYDELDRFGTPKDKPWNYRKTRIEQQEWWFARKFTLPESFKGKTLRLYFDGIDYSGSVYLNGKSLGHHTGMFGGPTRDITGMVSFDGQNEIVVRLDRTADTWNGILKGSPGFGWHYGHLISTGIWRDVRIEAVPEVELSSPYVLTKSISKDKAVLSVQYYVTASGDDPGPVMVSGTIRGANSDSKPISFTNRVNASNGETRVVTEIAIDNPRVWWPMNYGKQDLYRLDLEARAGNKAIDAKSARFGVRTIEMRPAAGTAALTDYRWQFVINGQPVFIKGANWCWSDPMLQLDPAKYERILELARRGGIQMFRAWGGGIIETDEFYRLCDEKGLMVYQEFPYCWGPPPFPSTDAAVLDQQVSQVVKRLRNHPSLIMWGGGNENGPNPGGDEALFLVGRRCRQYDPSRPYHRTDPWGGSGHSWTVFHYGAAIDTGYQQNSAVFYGEYGLPSMPNRSSTLRFLPKDALAKWPPDDSSHGVIAHLNQFMPFDLVKTLRYADYGPVADWGTYTEYSQMAQGDWLRFAAEGQRANSNENKTGFWFYKFTDLFPGHSWSVIDFYGQPKISYYRAKQTCRPQSAFIDYEKLDWAPGEKFVAGLHVANDTMTRLTGAHVKVTIFGSDLSALWGKDYDVPAIAENQRIDFDEIKADLDPSKIKPFLVAVSMRGSDGKLISDQWYWLNFKAKTEKIKETEKAFSPAQTKEAFAAYAEDHDAPLLRLPKTALTVRLSTAGQPIETSNVPHRRSLIIKNTGTVPAFNVIIDGFPDGYGSFLDDNSFSLRPAEEREIAFDLAPGASIKGISVRAWNAGAVEPGLAF